MYKEEHDKWWRGAELHKEFLMDKADQKVTVEIEGEIFPKPQVNKGGKDCLDYSVWDKWVPDDPVSLAEMKEKVDKVDKQKNAVFEKNNPDFCNNFKEDMDKREKTKVRKETNAERNRQKGNAKFKKKEYKGALKLYKEALALTPLVVPIMTNIAQACIKLKDYAEATEYCNRALFLDDQNTKALSRRALCYKKNNDFVNALKDLQAADVIDPGNASILKELKRCKMEKAEKEAEDEVLKLVQPRQSTAAPIGSVDAKKSPETATKTEKENTNKDSVSERAAAFLKEAKAETTVATETKKEQPKAPPVTSTTTTTSATTAATTSATTSVPSAPSTTVASAATMATMAPDNVPFEFKLMEDAHTMYNKWWNGNNETSTTATTMKENEENAKLAAGALVPLLLAKDALRIYFRRCGLSTTFHETLLEATTATMDVSITTAGTTTASASSKVEVEKETTRPTVSNSMLVTVLTAISAACRNRLVHEEFVQDFNGLNHVANVLSTAIVVDQTARATTTGSGKTPVKGTLADIALVRACVEVVEACTTHETATTIILKHVKKEARKMNLKKKKKSSSSSTDIELACQIPMLLLEVMLAVDTNTQVVRHAVDSLCTLTTHVHAEEVVAYMSLLSKNGLNIVHVLSNILMKTTGKNTSTHPSVDACREACARCMTALSIHSQWRAFFCAYDAIPSLISVLKPNTVDTVAARANALAALMNGACASGNMASEVYTEIQDQIHNGGAVAWLVHLMEPKETFTKVAVKGTNTKKAETKDAQTVAFESNYSRTTTASQRAALVLQKRSKKTLDDHVRERSAGLLVSLRFVVCLFVCFVVCLFVCLFVCVFMCYRMRRQIR